MGPIEDEIRKLREELAAAEARYLSANTTTPEELALYERVADHLLAGEEIPKELEDAVCRDDPSEGATMRDFLPVLRERVEEGVFDVVDEGSDGHEIVKER